MEIIDDDQQSTVSNYNKNELLKESKLEKNKELIMIKSKALAYFDDGMRITSIAKALNKPFTTIKRWISKFQLTGNLFKRKQGSGRKSRISDKVKASLKRKINNDPSLTYKQLSKQVSKIKKVSKSSVARYLKTVGKKYTPRNQEILNRHHMLSRVNYSEKYISDNLKNIIYSDECHIDINRNKKKYFHFKNEPKIGKTVMNPNIKIHIWGAISYKGKVSIAIIKGRLTKEAYNKLIENHLFKQADALYGKGKWRFQQDNHPAHKVTELFESKNIELIKHPARSPDLNPIESIWYSLKNKVSEYNPKNAKQLEEAVFKSWDTLDNALIKRTVVHLHKVFQATIDANGRYADGV